MEKWQNNSNVDIYDNYYESENQNICCLWTSFMIFPFQISNNVINEMPQEQL